MTEQSNSAAQGQSTSTVQQPAQGAQGGPAPQEGPKKLAIIASKGSLDWAYPPFILASTAASLDYEVEIFFTFYGLQLLDRDLDLQVSSLGNPGMPMPMPMPVMGQALPGMQAMMTKMMKRKMSAKGVVDLAELRQTCVDIGVKLVACQMTLDLFDMDSSRFIDGVELGGAATFFGFAEDANISLFI